MVKILITGANSYIGTSVENWLASRADKYIVDTIDMISASWKDKDFSQYDVVFHVAGIVHQKEEPTMEKLYDEVNHFLPVEAAKKAKASGVKQFIFLSTGAVYAQSNAKSKNIIISNKSDFSPVGYYGISKLKAEKEILPLQDEGFAVVILRPPMVYGKGGKGNYQQLSKIAKKIPIFPIIDNKRSMLYINNLCEFIRLMIDNEESGIFHPQNREYVNTSELVELIAAVNGKKIYMTRIFNPLISVMGKFMDEVNKAFGTFIYERELSEYNGGDYCVVDFKQSIICSEIVDI